MDTQHEQAVEIANLLQNWIDETTGDYSEEMVCGVTWTTRTLSIFVGDITVWDDQTSSGDDLTYETCRTALLEHIHKFAPFINK